MGKPRIILLVRHAQSEGNKNREIHQLIPDHRVKLTDEGWQQAEDAGRHLRSLLRPDDTLQFFTSPYRRTRETTEGILRTLTSPGDDDQPSPFSRQSITVYEEPRIREQDFGNFQPCSTEMQRMWQERADYGHFFYRIPDGESAADAYDRISGFNESLWRQFNEPDFPSVCVLVTHGLMTRVFLMKWYHWSVEYFEDLRNINHCEFIVMEKNADNGKYILQTKLRTWSELERQKMEAAEDASKTELKNLQRRNTLSRFLPDKPQVVDSPEPAKWGGCAEGCNHNHDQYPRRRLQKSPRNISLPPPAGLSAGMQESSRSNEHEDNPLITPAGFVTDANPLDAHLTTDGAHDGTSPSPAVPAYLLSGDGTDTSHTPHDEDRASRGYFQMNSREDESRVVPQRRPTVEDFRRWVNESGMGKGVKADALGDEPEDHEDERDSGDAPDHGDKLEGHKTPQFRDERAHESSVSESVY